MIDFQTDLQRLWQLVGEEKAIEILAQEIAEQSQDIARLIIRRDAFSNESDYLSFSHKIGISLKVGLGTEFHHIVKELEEENNKAWRKEQAEGGDV